MTLISRDQMPASTPYEQELRDRCERLERERDQLGAIAAGYEEKFKMQRDIVDAATAWREWRCAIVSLSQQELALFNALNASESGGKTPHIAPAVVSISVQHGPYYDVPTSGGDTGRSTKACLMCKGVGKCTQSSRLPSGGYTYGKCPKCKGKGTDADLPPELEHPANKLVREAMRAEALGRAADSLPTSEADEKLVAKAVEKATGGQVMCKKCRGFGFTKGSVRGPYDQVDCDVCAGTGKL